MGVYVSVRGWVDCVDGQEERVREIVDHYEDGLYSRGWSTVTGPNDGACFLYSGTIRERSIDWLLDQVEAMAMLPAPVDPQDRVRGLFLLHHEEDGLQEWQVRDGQLIAGPAPDRYDYLFA